MKPANDVVAPRKKAPVRPVRPLVGQEYRILLLAPTGKDAKLTVSFFSTAGYDVDVCWDMPQVCEKMQQGCGTMLLAEETIGPLSLDTLLDALKQQPSWSDVPIIIITGGSEASQRRLRQLAASGPASNVALLERPFHPETMLSMVEVSMRSRQRQYQVRDLLRVQRANELRLQNILESIADAFVALDKDWCFTYINQSYMDLVSPVYKSSSELLGQNLWKKFPDIVGSPTGRFYERVMATQKADVMEIFYAPINRWLEVHAHPAPEILSLYISDITERKQQGHRLRELTLKIEDQARVFDATLSHMADLAYSFDSQGRLIYANKPLLDLWGKTLEDSVGKNVFELDYPIELAPVIHGQLLGVIASGKPFHGEVNFRSVAGVEDVHDYIFNPVFGPDGTVVAVAGTSRIITERKRYEALLREAKESAEAANHAKDRFLAVLSHELRTPLTPVLMTVASMEVDPSFPPETRESFSMIRRNVELETKLIDDLLDLNRVASGKLVLHLEPVDLNAAVRDVCRICGPQISEKGVLLHCDLAEDAGFVRADPARFRQVLWNLFNNAVKFTPAKRNIYIATTRLGGDRAGVEVRDEGIGIPSDIMPRIFDAFEQGEEKTTRQFGGLGLGLAICKALVELHHGTLRVESNGTGAGSTFFMELPGDTTPQQLATAAAQPEEQTLLHKLHLLVVEDHVDTANALSRLLRRSGYLVETAPDAASALALARNGAFDLVISDLGLPDATGYDLMKQLRLLGVTKGIAMSGFGMDDDLRRSRESGFSEHLVKPVNVMRLREAIQRVTGQEG